MNPPESFPGVRITEPRSVLLWDGQCAFCARSVRWLERHASKPVRTLPAQEVLIGLPEPVRAAAAHEVLWITEDGDVFGGSQAIIHVLRASGHPLEAFALRAVQPLSRWIYRYVAARRACLSGACRLKY